MFVGLDVNTIQNEHIERAMPKSLGRPVPCEKIYRRPRGVLSLCSRSASNGVCGHPMHYVGRFSRKGRGPGVTDQAQLVSVRYTPCSVLARRVHHSLRSSIFHQQHRHKIAVKNTSKRDFIWLEDTRSSHQGYAEERQLAKVSLQYCT